MATLQYRTFTKKEQSWLTAHGFEYKSSFLYCLEDPIFGRMWIAARKIEGRRVLQGAVTGSTIVLKKDIQELYEALKGLWLTGEKSCISGPSPHI